MLGRIIKRGFSQIQPSGSFNALAGLNRLKSTVRAPIKHLKRLIEPAGVNYQTMTNLTEEGFDEAAHEWQALITHNPFDVQVFNPIENAQAMNFGTVDNPLTIFSSEVPFRYVGCTGQMNEDDYEGHELLFFMLREGPLQRCPQCGQVFKLVRLRNEYSPEMDYYLGNFHTYDMLDMGEADTWQLMSLTKYASHYEYSQFETPSNMVYQLINPDEHDRILTDPAYRMERTAIAEQKTKAYIQSLKEVDQKYWENVGGERKMPIQKVDYQTLIDVEKAVLKIDRRLRKVARFSSRKFLDRENHERREARMLQRKSERWDNNYALYPGELTEEEQQYRDYFETDLERDPEVEGYEEQLDERDVLTRADYKLSRFDFQEMYTRNPEDDQSSLVEKLVFEFRYRLAKDSLEEYEARQKKVVERQAARFQQAGFVEKVQRLSALQSYAGFDQAALRTEKEILDFVVEESKNLIRDYFEGVKTPQELAILDVVDASDAVKLVAAFENHVLNRQVREKPVLIPKRAYDRSQGLWFNFVQDFNYLTTEIVPRARVLHNQAAAQQVLPENADQNNIENVKIFQNLL